MLRDLEEKGYSMMHIDEIFGEGYYLKNLKPIANVVKEKLNNDLMTEGGGDRFKRGKDFVARFYDEDLPISLDDKINELVINNFFYDLAVKHLGSHPRITNIDYWLNIPKKDAPKSSQKWHRDYEDLKLLKVFLYLGDVSLESGPLSYIESSQHTGKFGSLFPRKFPNGVVVDDKDIESYFINEEQKTFTLKDGTIVFADTSGLHKGGHCISSERFLYTFTYTSFAGISKRNFKISTDKAFFAVEGRKKLSLQH
ncbi:MAG: hypothetical protein ACOYLT_03445 [Flavobacterium sp.]|uniref:hypothetical protein n=1 Tax=Flavobacterium sp. TaxID=239 RepID=UPI003BDD6040